MSDSVSAYLTATFGSREAGRLVTAYEAAILTISLGQLDLMPDRSTRLAMVEALMTEAERGPLDTEALTTAALRAAKVW